MRRTRAKTVQGALRATVRRLREVGWTQGMACDPQGRECLNRALDMTIGDDALYAQVRDEVNRRLGEKSPPDYNDIVGWNDQPGRTFEQVLTVLEHA